MPDIDIDFSVQGRERVFALRDREVRARPRGADHHVLEAAGEGLRARRRPRDGHAVRRRRPHREADPRGPEGQLRRLPQAGAGAAKACDEDEAARQIVEIARPLEGLTRADSIHAAGVVIGDRPLMEYLPLQQKGAEAARHAVHDGRRRGARPAQDGLPRPAQPRRDRRGRPHRRASRPASISATCPTCRWTTRRPTRCSPRRHAGGLPVRVVGHARRVARGQADLLRPPRRAGGAVPARPDGRTSRCTRGARTGLEPRHLHHQARADPRLDDGHHIYQEQAMQIAKDLGRLHARRGRRSAQGDRQEDPLADGLAREKFLEGCERTASRAAWPRRSGPRTSAPPTTRSTRPTPPATR